MTARTPMTNLTRRRLLETFAVSAGGLAAGAFGLPDKAEAAVAGGRPVELTEFIWVGSGQGVVPREVNTAYEKANPNVKVTLYEGSERGDLSEDGRTTRGRSQESPGEFWIFQLPMR